MEGSQEVADKMDKLKVDEKAEDSKEEKKVDPTQESKAQEDDEDKIESKIQQDGEIEISGDIPDFHRNQESKFLSSSKSWEDEEIGLPETIKQALRDADLKRPSKIQAYAVPAIISPPHKSLIAQSHNGSGKTFAFSIGALMRVDPEVKGLQVLILAHVRELVHQIYEQITLLNKYTKYDICEIKREEKNPHIGQIVIATPAKVTDLYRKKRLNFSEIKTIVIDEADYFFGNESDLDKTKSLIKDIDTTKEGNQKLFFSATYPEAVANVILSLVPENCIKIRLKEKQLTLKGVKQMYFVANTLSKFKIVEDLFNEFDNTQMIVFVNTKKFGEMAHKYMTTRGYKADIITGNVEPEQRDIIMEKFRKRELQFVFATNVLSRGIDISDMKLMINLDIPFIKDKDGFINGDFENYLHRIGRTGRFDTKGIALTIIDGRENVYDKEMECLQQIQEHYHSEINELKSIQDLPEIFKNHVEE